MAGDWKKRESFKSALIQVGIVGVILAVAVFFVVYRGISRRDSEEGVKEARKTALRDNPGDLKKALVSLQPMLEGDGAPEAIALAADLQTSLWMPHHVPGADAEARSLLARAEAANARSEERYSAHALQLLADGKTAEADTYVDDLRKQGASSPKLWFALGETYARSGQWLLAKQAYARAIEKGWRSPRFFAGAAEAYLAEGSQDLAIETLEKGLGVNPEHVWMRLTLVLARLQRGQPVPDAEAVIVEVQKSAQGQTPGLQARAQTVRAELALAAGRSEDALTMASDALSTVRDEPVALLTRARVLGATKAPGALEAYRTAAAARKMAPAAYFDGARVLSAAGNFDGAAALLDDYEQAFQSVVLTSADGKTRPALERDDRFWLAKGTVLRSAGKPDLALAAFDKAIAAGSVNLARAHTAKGSLLLSQGKLDLALAELKAVTPDDGSGMVAEAYLTVGEALFAKNDLPAACQNYAYGLAKLRREQAPKERLTGVLDDVNKKLLAAKQPAMAKAWLDEARPLIQ